MPESSTIIPNRNLRITRRWPSARARALAVVGAAALGLPGVALAQTPPDYGYQWATITHENNPAYPRPPIDIPNEDYLVGRGSVGYEYRIAKGEVGTAEWMEFTNTFSVQANFPLHLFGNIAFTQSPPIWGAGTDGSYSGPGTRYALFAPSSATRPVYGITWREAAMYCNWLHNGKSSDPASLFSGAYDTSTWDTDGRSPYTDALTHESGAKFWIPTYDEWIKAVYWDPENPNRDGWWKWVHGKETPPVSGMPGTPGAETSAGLERTQAFDPVLVRLGSYPDALSPWGLLDTASGAAEWNEEPFWPGDLIDRGYMGASALDSGGTGRARLTNSMSTNVTSGVYSFRLASAIPSPGCSIVVILVGLETLIRRRRDENHMLRSCRVRGTGCD